MSLQPVAGKDVAGSPSTMSVAQPTIENRHGPYDFFWLLERCADYADERPLWHRGGSLPSDFRSDPPPPPLQLLVPEVVAFEPQDSKGRSVPRAVFFTDRAGFLRGGRRCVKQGFQLCQGLLRLMSHRQPVATLTHNLGVSFELHHLLTGAKAWTDKPYVYSGIPKEMEGAVFFAGPYSSVPTGELLLSAPVHGMAYIWSEDKTEANGGLPTIGWEVVPGGMTFGNGRVMKIYRNILTAGASLVIPVNYMWLGGVAFQPHELPEAEAQGTMPELRGSISSANGSAGHGHRRVSNLNVGDAEPLAGSKRKAKVSKRHTFTDTKGANAGHWRLTFYNGATKRVSNDEVASHFGLTADGRASPWPTGAKLIQAHCWSGHKRQGGEQSIFYKYDALRAEASAEDKGISDNILNHFERHNFMTDVACHTMISAAPVQISQHLAYYCMLELVSGDFEFVKDMHGQLWLVDARNLYLIRATRSVEGTSSSAQASADGKSSVSHKLPRYLSEEALHNVKLSELAGDKCQRMTELMLGHYKQVKDVCGMDDMLRKTDEVVEISIPMFAGTDTRAFSRTFGIKKEKRPEVGVNVGLALSADQRRHPTMPKQGGFIGKGRLVTGGLPRPLSTPPQQRPGARRFAARQSQQQTLAGTAASNASGALSTGQAWATPRAALGDSTKSGKAMPLSPLAATDRSAKPRSRTNGVDEETAFGGAEESGVGIEIVLPESALKLLHNSGPGLRPNGPTLDIVGPPAVRSQGVGLKERRTAGKTQVRAVDVPNGVASACLPSKAPCFLKLF